jgi:hypothetical protein
MIRHSTLPFPTLSVILVALGALELNAQAQTVTDVVVPQYVVNGSTTASRLQSAYRVSLSGLAPNATYRYTSGASNVTTITTGTAPGNYFGINNTANGFGYIQGTTSNKNLNGAVLTGDVFSSSANYSEFTTDASGAYTGWYAIVPTGNAAFTAGNSVYFYEQINDGGSGIAIAQSLLTTSTAIALTPGTSGANTATFIYGQSGLTGETFVLLYDNEAGTGRPLWGTWTESDGITTNYTTQYDNASGANVGGTAGAWGAYVPNALANGVRRVEYRDINNTLLASFTDSDGVWGGFNTVNPSGGTTTPINLGTLVAVPEPSSVTLVLAGVAVLGGWRRVRRVA